jgi:hypothetical protein
VVAVHSWIKGFRPAMSTARLASKSTISRTITALKTRASRNDPRVREFRIGAHGIALSDIAAQRSPTDPRS